MQEAVVIAFPGATPAARDQARLTKAMADLQAAIESQRKVLGEWRFAMAELGIGVAGLSHALAGYQESLASVRSRIGDLHGEAARLSAWADHAPPRASFET